MIGKHYRRRAGIITLVVFIAVLLIGQSIPLAYAGDLESNQTQNAEKKKIYQVMIHLMKLLSHRSPQKIRNLLNSRNLKKHKTHLQHLK